MDISIIVPVYNAERYLKECLNSALKQTVKSKEIICIDDGSTDNSNFILQEYSDKYKEINVIWQKNKGPGEARNAGLDIAKGEYVCFLDADDYYLDQYALEKMIEACKKHNVKVCGSFRKILNIQSNKIEEFDLHRGICKDNSEGVLLNYLDYQDDYHYQNYIFSLEMIKENRIKFPFYRRYQDPPFFLKTMIIAKEMWIMPVELYCLRLGHQNYKQHGKLIEHTLMGICDNMELAKQYRLYELQKRLISKINEDFYGYIVDNFNKTIFNILMSIQNKVLDSSMQEIRYLNEVMEYYKLKSNYSELGLSYYIMRILVESRNKGITIPYYLSKMKIYNIAIYGLGNFGTILYNELKKSKIRIIYGIDKNKRHFEDLPVYYNVKELEKCDAIIVTPLNERDIIATKLKNQVNIPVYTLVEIINNIEKIYEG